MEKPTRILASDKIRTFNDKVRGGLEHALNFMLGTDEKNKVTFSSFDLFLMPIESYIAAYKKKSILIKIYAENAFEGEIYWFFEMKSAVVLGGKLRLLAEATLKEKADKGEFDAMDQDAFGEVGNQLSGILDRAFRVLTNKNIHLRMDFNKKVYPDENIKFETFVNKEEYVVFLGDVFIPDFGKQKLTLLLPRSLYEVLLNIEIELEGITPKVILINSHSEEKMDQLRTKLNSRYIKMLQVEKPEEILDRLDTPNLAAVGIDLKSLSVPLPLNDTIFFKRLVANRTLMRLPLFLTWENPSDESIKEVHKLGIKSATKANFLTDFPAWVSNVTKDPGFKG